MFNCKFAKGIGKAAKQNRSNEVAEVWSDSGTLDSPTLIFLQKKAGVRPEK
jgi:hypothetical protein